MFYHISSIFKQKNVYTSVRTLQRYTLLLKKVTFNLSFCPGAPGSLNLIYGLENDPGSLTLTLGHEEKLLKKR